MCYYIYIISKRYELLVKPQNKGGFYEQKTISYPNSSNDGYVIHGSLRQKR